MDAEKRALCFHPPDPRILFQSVWEKQLGPERIPGHTYLEDDLVLPVWSQLLLLLLMRPFPTSRG